MIATINNIKSFFKDYPFGESKRPNAIDYVFFEKTIPKVISAKLERSISPPGLNIFEGFNLGENELKHCSVLSWFLNPRSNHCQGQLFLDSLLKKYGFTDIMKYTDGGYFTVSTEDNYSEQGRVDITISNDNFWFIIEAKISASEQNNQITRYNNILSQKSQIFGIPKSRCKLFYLTRDGEQPTTGVADVCISWKGISEVLVTFASHCKNEYVSLTAMQYARYIQNNI